MSLGDLVHYQAAAHLCKEKMKQVEDRRLEVRKAIWDHVFVWTFMQDGGGVVIVLW